MSTYSFNISSSELLGGSDDDSYQLEVEFYFQPEEPMVMYYPDGSGYPGSAESREIERVLWTRKVGKETVTTDIYPLIECVPEMVEVLEKRMWDFEFE